MERVSGVHSRAVHILFTSLYFHRPFRPSYNTLSFPFCPYSPYISQITLAKKSNSQSSPVLKPVTIKEDVVDDLEFEEDVDEEKEEEEDVVEEFENDVDDYFEDDLEAEDTELYVGDGGGGGGIVLAGTWWDKEALAIAEDVSLSFDGDLKIYAFKTYINSTIRVRIEKASNKYGSPSITDIEAFSSAYRECLDEAECVGTIPKDVSLEVSSPGVERIVRIPQDLDRFKDSPMYVKYVDEVDPNISSQEKEGIFKLVSYDLESSYCTWSIADVRRNREQSGKGRLLSKKQREWRLQIPFGSLHLVRLHSEC